ncbi:amino acid adenylation domain-containing protein [Kitasatospora sp. NPDC006697]|uniref:non-ribosomal peptide synthetase n=1 Tax=Kitasatospora sp. NPDC006697 TaxID=3364020 RepID=UPI0036CB9ADA
MDVNLAQSGIWFTERLGGLGTVYSMPFAVTLHGPLDQDALLAALRTVVDRHPVLAGALREQDGLPRLVPAVQPPQPVVVDLSATPELQPEHERAEILRPFDPAHGPLLRCTLYRTAPETHRLLVVVHHLAFDGQSTSLFLDELAAAYAGAELPALPEPEDPADQHDRVTQALPGARAFWKQRWSEPAEVRLPGLHGTPRTAGPGESVGFEPDPRLRPAIAALGISTFQFTLSSWLVLLRRYGNLEPVLGVDFGTRTAEQCPLIGAHVNELPVAQAPRLDQSFRTFVDALVFGQGLRSDLRGLFRYREVPLGRAVAGVRPAVALAPVTLAYRRRGAAPDFPGLRAEVDWALPNHTARGTLRIHQVDGPEGWRTVLQYDPDRLDRADAERIARHWQRLAAALAEHPDTPLAELEFAPEEAELERRWNATAVERPAATLPELLAAQAAATPQALAVSGTVELTYRQLADRVDSLARHIEPGSVVAILAERGPAALIGQLATLRAGAAYLPLDPAHPVDRLRALLADAGAALVLTDRPLDGIEARPLPDPAAAPEAAPRTDRAHPGPADRAYVLYTSGSTGRPKGVEIEHRALTNLLLDFRDRLSAAPEHRWLALTAPTFDIAALELYLPLVSGGRVVFAPPTAHADGRAVVELIERQQISHVQATPSGWQLLLDAGLREVPVALVGGEALPPTLAQQLLARTGRLLNVYGPTETTVWSTAAELTGGAQGGIGTPLANTTVRLLDPTGLPLPHGLPGELWIGGAGLARGYLGRPELTAERFVTGPDGERRYRTGDLARRRPDGCLEFLGRLDGQLKLRGHRIEPGEIEAQLLTHPQVARAAVTVLDPQSPGGGRLVAHLVATDPVPGEPELRAHLARTLPAVLHPSLWRLVDELPLTGNGKVDRLALAAWRPQAAEQQAPRPERGGTAAAVHEIWCEVLGLPGIGDQEDLFDLGGHSLTVTQIGARIASRLGVDLPLHVFYDDATIAGMAAAVDRVGSAR